MKKTAGPILNAFLKDMRARKKEKRIKPRRQRRSKPPGHVEQRASERTTFTPKEIEKVRSLVKRKQSKLKRRKQYQVKYPGRGAFIVGDVGEKKPKHVVKTVYGPNMRAKGEMLKASSRLWSIHEKTAKKLNAKARGQVATGNFALPRRRYPIHDINHGRNALARVSQHGTSSEKAKVRRAVYSRYPNIDTEKTAFFKTRAQKKIDGTAKIRKRMAELGISDHKELPMKLQDGSYDWSGSWKPGEPAEVARLERITDELEKAASWGSTVESTDSMTEALAMYKEASLSDKTKRRLKITAGVLGGATVAGLGLAATSPFVRAEAANFLRNIGKNIHKADLQRSLPPGAVQDAKRVEKLLLSKGIDPRKAKISVTGAGGTGKTTFSRALAKRMGNRHAHPANIHKHLDTEIKRSAFGWDFTKYKPQAGTLSEQTHLLAQSDPKNYDVMIHLEKPVKTVKKQLLSRGKGATQYPIEDYRKLQTNLRNAFDITDGKAQSVGSHIRVKIRPKGGFNADANLDKKLKALGISPKGMRRSDKVLSVTQGRKSKYRGIPSYLRKDTLGALAGAGITGGAAGGYAMSKQAEAEYRKITVNGKTVELDKEIPLFSRIPKDPKKARRYFQRRIRATKQENWSHPQIAIPANYDISKIQNYRPTRFAIPLPGETPFTTSYRMGRLHAHKRGPVYLMHEDAHEPMSTNDGILSGAIKTIKHTPEAIEAVVHGIRKGAPEPVKLAAARKKRKAKPKLRILYVDETGAGHRSQARNVAQAARKVGIDAEAIDWSENFGSKRVGKRYRDSYMNFLEKKNVRSLLPLAGNHIAYHTTSVDRKKLDRYLKKNKDSAIVLAHPHLEGHFIGKKRPVSLLHTDPVKWPGLIHLPAAGARQHIGDSGVVSDMKGHKKELTGLPVAQTLLQKRLPKSGLINRKRFSVTVSGGGEGLEVPEMAREVLKSNLPDNAQVHVVTGRNEKARKTLERLAKKDKRLIVHGFAPLAPMMREADLNVIRAHGTSYAETLTSGRPAVYYGPSKNLLDIQGKLTRDTAIHGHGHTGYPHAVGHDEIAPAVSSVMRDYKKHMRTARKLKRGYGDPGRQAAMGAVEFHRKHTKVAVGGAKTARAPRNYRREYDQYHGKPGQVKNRAKRNSARTIMGLAKGDPREVDHIIPMKLKGPNTERNLRVVSMLTNRKKFAKAVTDTAPGVAREIAGFGSSNARALLSKKKKPGKASSR